MSTQGHESEAINVSGLKASLKKGGNIGIYNEAICSTAGGTAAKVTNTTPPSFTLTAGAKILVKFTYAISAENATLQVGSNSAKPIYYKGSALPADLVKAGTSLLLAYDGTNFNIVGDINTDTTYSVMGASGSTHASGLVPDTPSTAGTTKFLREDGTWQEVNAAPEVQLGGNTPSSDSEIKLFVDENDDDTVEVYTKAQAAGQFVAVVNMNTEPTESTLTYTATDGTTKSFKVGDEIRVPDAEADNGYTFYKLYALTTESNVTTAVWDKLGAGGDIEFYETLNISLTQVNGNNADLIGATVTITDDDTSDTIYSGTWNGTTLVTTIPVNTNYTVTISSIIGYINNELSKTDRADAFVKDISFLYLGYGAYIEATDGSLYTSSMWASSGKTANAIVLTTSNTSFKMEIPKGDSDTHNVRKLTAKSVNINGPKYSDSTAALDYDGKTNTTAIYTYNNSAGETAVNTYAAPYCVNYTFPDGTKGGYLPAAGQTKAMILNKSSINQCLTAIGKNYGLNEYILSSTLSSELSNNEYCCYHMSRNNNEPSRYNIWYGYNTITVKDL